MLGRYGIVALTVLASAGCSQPAAPINVTGSSTVYPFTKIVADRFVATTKGAAAPVIHSVGTVTGIKTFCAGPGAPDILNASRRINRKEFAGCQTNKAGEIMEIPIGLDGIALAEANGGPKLSLTSKDLYLALAANPRGQPNTAKTWRDVNPTLPAIPIKVLGPPTSSGTRESFVTLILEPGCIEAMPEAAAMRSGSDPATFDRACRQIRDDGPYVTASEDYSATAQALERDPTALGLFGYSYLEQRADRLRGVPINGVVPTATTIAHGDYKGIRQLFLYVKKGHLTAKPSVQAFLDLYAKMWTPGGPLAKAGLIPMTDRTASRSLAVIKNGYPIEAAELP